jgi:hypothetical protein
MILQTTTHYRLEVGVGQFESYFKGLPCYRVINSETGVCERESLEYANALLGIHALEHALQEVGDDPAATFAVRNAEAERNRAMMAAMLEGHAPDSILN